MAPSGFATSTKKGAFAAMLISRSNGTCLLLLVFGNHLLLLPIRKKLWNSEQEILPLDVLNGRLHPSGWPEGVTQNWLSDPAPGASAFALPKRLA